MTKMAMIPASQWVKVKGGRHRGGDGEAAATATATVTDVSEQPVSIPTADMAADTSSSWFGMGSWFSGGRRRSRRNRHKSRRSRTTKMRKHSRR
jgi:hypothetical protein